MRTSRCDFRRAPHGGGLCRRRSTLEERSVNDLVDKQLKQYAENLKRFGAEEAKKEEKDKT
ncbi:MAG: hypothetical protein JSV10_09510 [Candidatus Zixiibacteriota bacterium]|nr:MAG: hypothetical protein JSV10_09510 [candidate division Zixibacteria bacterium]